MLEEKIEALTKAVVSLRQSIEANGTGSTSASTKAKASEDDDEDKPTKATRGRKPKVETKYDADQVGAIIRKLAKVGDDEKDAVKRYIKKQGCADLAELCTKPELFDAAYEWAEKQLAEDDDV